MEWGVSRRLDATAATLTGALLRHFSSNNEMFQSVVEDIDNHRPLGHARSARVS